MALSLARALRKTYKDARKTYRDNWILPIDESLCLFEAGQGKNVHGNMFALVRELNNNQEFSRYNAVFVVTDDTMDKAKKLFKCYGLKAEMVVRDSERYMELLARAKYLFTDNSLPVYFRKRPEQVYVNTWHGTPLKHLGRSNIKDAIVSFSNIQKNFLSADYLLFPNELTKQCFFKDYCLRKLFNGAYLYADYPRNDVFSNRELAREIKHEQGLDDLRVAAYMPTWRGSGRKANVEEQLQYMQRLFSELDEKLGDDEVLYVNLHFLISGTLDYAEYRHIRQFPAEYETYDFLNACDVLITDFSSVFFDYANSGKKIVLYAEDRESYLEKTGTYIEYESLPFPIADTVEELVDLVYRQAEQVDEGLYPGFQEAYCAYHNGRASRELLELALLGKSNIIPRANEEACAVNLRYVDNFTTGIVNDVVRSETATNWAEDDILVFQAKPFKENANFLKNLPEEVDFLSLTMVSDMTAEEQRWYGIEKHFPLASFAARKHTDVCFEREGARLIPGVNIKSVTLLAVDNIQADSNNYYYARALATLPCDTVAVVRHIGFHPDVSSKTLERWLKSFGYETVRGTAPNSEGYDERACSRYFARTMSAVLITREFAAEEDAVVVRGTIRITFDPSMNPENLYIDFKEPIGCGSLKLQNRRSTVVYASYLLRVALEDALSLPMQNAICVHYLEDGLHGVTQVRFSQFKKPGDAPFNDKPYLDEEHQRAIVFRQSMSNNAYLTIREINASDYPENAKMIREAYKNSLSSGKSDDIVVFEKESERYEESGAVVYEALIDKGYKNVWYILDDNCPYKDEIPEKYRQNIVSKNSARHYELFFRAKTFIGSEMLAHAIELRTSNEYIMKRLNNPDANYVFLQHGVMYMISLDSAGRRFFTNTEVKGKYRVVTSSKAEKRHFVRRANMPSEYVYVCGLPKFDRSYRYPDNDLIVIMPTWRPWEANAVTSDVAGTTYYQMIVRILSAIPEELRDKVRVLPHPLFQKAIENTEFALSQYHEEGRYDDILRRTRMLITDYSSIAYDAFYRGANVVFYWEEKAECLQAYGPHTRLLLKETNAFGDICYSADELTGVIERNYNEPQKEEYIQKYRRIVEFRDGHNTDRLIEMMKSDGII